MTSNTKQIKSEQQNCSLAQLATNCGVDHCAFSRWEKGKQRIFTTSLGIIAKTALFILLTSIFYFSINYWFYCW